jgi:hypothetical protein
MARRKTASDVPKEKFDLRSHAAEQPIEPDQPRFHLFLVDTGWNVPVSKAVRHQLPLIYRYQKQDTLYILTHEQSVEALKKSPNLIGHDPTIMVFDLYLPPGQPETGTYRGFRLNLGLMRNPEQALARLQEFVRFVAEHRTAQKLDLEVRREMHREGVDGLVKILRGGLEAGIELV